MSYSTVAGTVKKLGLAFAYYFEFRSCLLKNFLYTLDWEKNFSKKKLKVPVPVSVP
jgi:hypothetical protein